MEELGKRSFNDIIYFIRKGDSMKAKKFVEILMLMFY